MFLDHFGAPHRSIPSSFILDGIFPTDRAPPPTDDNLNMASKPPTPPHLLAPYKSVDFFMKMPSMMKHSVVTLDATGTKFISWKA
ncbi:hypothetical protein CROQUDRAFT_102399 [Cronartium quercuum f. sp. fusiforme G11]|uniref:Uncharacterized protein n=1 Tax=Cronartium quercuum f. sp. fusiforme G11 TaxID=708437 RepID=A0A9P6N771_9BASI|nr:hypothetical protein CROQUDRAFT_102399 [Cronartium quercuum f. sp. fusiforme G11]